MLDERCAHLGRALEPLWSGAVRQRDLVARDMGYVAKNPAAETLCSLPDFLR